MLEWGSLRPLLSPSFCVLIIRILSALRVVLLSESRYGSSLPYTLSVARVGFSPSLELIISRAGVYCLNYDCCCASTEPLSTSASPALLLGPFHIVSLGYIVGFCVSCCVGLGASLFARLRGLYYRCFHALISVNFQALIAVVHRRALLARGFCAILYYSLCFCFALSFAALCFVGCFTIVFAYLSDFICICMNPLCFFIVYSNMTVGCFAHRADLVISHRGLVALGICAGYYYGFSVLVFVGIGIYFCISVRFYFFCDRYYASCTFYLKHYLESEGFAYLSVDEILDSFIDIIWPPEEYKKLSVL